MDTADLHAALDAARVIITRLKPVLALPDVIEAALKAEIQVSEAEAALNTLRARREAFAIDVAALEDKRGAAQRALDEEQARVSRELTALADQVHAARNRAQADMLQARESASLTIANADADAAARKVSLNAEIAALEARVDVLEAKRKEFVALLQG